MSSGKDIRLKNDGIDIVLEGYTGADDVFCMPEEVTAVADRAFANNKRLRSVDLGNVTRIGDYAFQDCSNLESVVMDRAEKIGAGAFEFCRSLKKVSLGAVQSIGAGAFLHCKELDIPKIPESLTSIGEGAFSHTALRTACLDRFEEIPPALFSGCTYLTYADISSARVIGDSAFSECKALSSVRAGKAEIIGRRAFYKCSSLEPARLPAVLTHIGDEAFEKTSDALVVPLGVSHFGRNCFGPVDRKKKVSIYRTQLSDFRNYFAEERRSAIEEDEHFHLWESSIDINVLDEKTGEPVGYLPLFSDLDDDLRAKMIAAFGEDNSFDYSFIDEVLYAGLRWNRRCMDSVAFRRLQYPYELGEDARRVYTDHLINHSLRIALSAVNDNDTELLSFLLEGGFVQTTDVQKILDHAVSLGAYDCTAFLLERISKVDGYYDPLADEL